MDRFSGLEKGKLYTVAGVEEVRISAKNGIDIVFDEDSKNLLVGEFDRFDLDSSVGDIVRVFVNDCRDLRTDALEVLAEVEIRPDGEFEIARIADYEEVFDPYDEDADEDEQMEVFINEPEDEEDDSDYDEDFDD